MYLTKVKLEERIKDIMEEEQEPTLESYIESIPQLYGDGSDGGGLQLPQAMRKFPITNEASNKPPLSTASCRSPQLKRQVDHAKERGASSWLSVLPLSDHGFHLHKGDFREGCSMLWTLQDTPRPEKHFHQIIL